MASETKKRRKSRSPVRDTASKRARVSAASTPGRSPYAEREAQSSRAGSIKDGYPAPKPDRAFSLPTGDDWIFRVQVISSATDLGSQVFKNAVKGLVRICFPDNILDQLGPQVLQQHMREEKAPEANIRKMLEIFRTEMIQRMVPMVAKHLHSAAEVDWVLQTVLIASARARGDGIGEDILGHVTANLLQSKARAPEHSTEWLASGKATRKEDNSDGDLSTDDVFDEEPAPIAKAKKHKKRDKKAQCVRSTTPDDITEDVEMNADLSAASNKHTILKSKDKKISSKWKWNVEATELADEDVAEAFPRTSDLFAYHALPITRRKLGSQASRKETRCEMQALLDGMPQDEFEKWVESLQKLYNGDREMLVRQDVASSSVDRQITRATPAPVEFRKKTGKSTKISSSSSDQSKGRATNAAIAVEKTVVKEESAAGSSEKLADPTDEATAAYLRACTEARDTGRPLSSVEAADGHTQSEPQSNGTFDSVSDLGASKTSLR
ncbi:hypothetical protein J4E90_003086 [Alternaria incomplexa]|uniref:uncharacterized protein n=1 Tax=Alternaria incomplexa TaxID=1187928 RepID=UPI00221F24F8|nr:uncharacterized protein J4E90_003086 [Alternaria incomplexa]KAI4918699.1 hypothetical protein J4E90_003086 [Alternaria incomplexa]